MLEACAAHGHISQAFPHPPSSPKLHGKRCMIHFLTQVTFKSTVTCHRIIRQSSPEMSASAKPVTKDWNDSTLTHFYIVFV